MDSLLKILEAACEILGALSVLATVVVRLTPSKKDDQEAVKWIDMVQKVLHYAPTLGINPKTKALQQAYADLKAELDSKADGKEQV